MSRKSALYGLVGAALVCLIGGYTLWSGLVTAEAEDYNPTINPADFVPGINHKLFTLKPGTKFTFQAKTSEGRKRIEEHVTHDTKVVMGVTTTVVRVREWLNDVIQEEAFDWYAQDKDGNVWYFGEWVDIYERGKLKNHAGSWEAGVDGAKPGIIMPKEPKVGDTYRQEYYKGHAEDMGTVVALGKKVKVPYGAFDDCVQIKGWSKIESASDHKYHCPAAGFWVLEEDGGERVELVRVSNE